MAVRTNSNERCLRGLLCWPHMTVLARAAVLAAYDSACAGCGDLHERHGQHASAWHLQPANQVRMTEKSVTDGNVHTHTHTHPPTHTHTHTDNIPTNLCAVALILIGRSVTQQAHEGRDLILLLFVMIVLLICCCLFVFWLCFVVYTIIVRLLLFF